ncbi:hypothetical protein BDV23DRAFT_167271 [Aspergillus alliaceus]|uniref:Uncharacterized protein n=1 Tax=Petromyces alliaceus TaxID=209559 RepID=A0A5N7BRK2_PETAA|nr:hypothetical protein BDV23DRAFT_167271 [Aspergillus alliaceus]
MSLDRQQVYPSSKNPIPYLLTISQQHRSRAHPTKTEHGIEPMQPPRLNKLTNLGTNKPHTGFASNTIPSRNPHPIHPPPPHNNLTQSQKKRGENAIRTPPRHPTRHAHLRNPLLHHIPRPLQQKALPPHPRRQRLMGPHQKRASDRRLRALVSPSPYLC